MKGADFGAKRFSQVRIVRRYIPALDDLGLDQLRELATP
jgi:hypothetical protein